MKNIIFIPQINLIILIQLIKQSFNLICDSKTIPFLKDNSCISFCSKEELNSKKCVISNEIVKIQYLSNLIIIGSKDYRYINIVSNESNDMVIQTSKFEGTGDRLFYGLKNNGRFLFMNGENEYPYLSYIITGEATEKQQRFEGESCFIKLCDLNNPSIDGKTYFLSIAKADQYAELFDFDSLEYTVKSSINFIGNEIYSDRGTFIRLYNTDDTDFNYYYLYAGVNKESSSNFKCILKSFYVNKKDISQLNEVAETEESDCSENKMISCFETKEFRIICFYRVSYSSSIYYKITFYSCCFDVENYSIIVESGSPNTFYKGIHLKEEIGVFIYFSDEESTNPKIFFKNFDSDQIRDYKNFGSILLDYEFNNNYMLNDIIKISDTKICYISPNLNNDVINVAMLSLFNNDNNLNIRYYSQLIYKQNHYMIFKELRLHLYTNQYITLAASVCNTTNCVNSDDEHYASFFIFSYPNSNDVIIKLVNLLYKTNEEITKISFNLEEHTTIENNLFGFVFEGIQIISLPDNIQLISTKTNLTINSGYIMSKDENFTLNFGTTNIYQINIYNIEYALMITEGDYNDIINLISKSESYGVDNAEEQYGGGTYLGRTSYFKIIIEYELTTIGCNNDDNDICSLCLSADNNICISCKDIEGNPKICKGKEDQSTTIPLSFDSTLFSPSFFSYSYFVDSEKSPSPSPSSTGLTPKAPISYNNSSSTIRNPGSPNTFECNKTQILENKCKEGELASIQIEEIHNSLKENLKDFNNTKKTIETKNAVFQLCTLEQQKNSFLLNISSIDLGECESVIKEKEGLTDNDQLIVIKTDIKDEESKSTYVQYELYHPIYKNEIDLSICENKITINVPVYLDNNIEEMTDKLSESGYNIFDKNDSFYNNICTKFTTKNGTDIILTDRRNDIYDLVKNVSLCQDGCNFEYYNSTSKKATCVCNIQENSNFISDIKEIGKSFYKEIIIGIFSKSIVNSNFLVLKCYKLALCFKDHIYNYGCITLTLLILVYIAFMIKYFIKDRSIINEYIQNIISHCFYDSEDKKNKSKNRKHIVNNKSNKLTNEKSEKKKKKIVKLKDNLKNNEDNYNIKKSINVTPKRQLNDNNKSSSKNDNDSTKMKIKSLTINNLIINNKNSNPQPIPLLEIGRKNMRNTKFKTTKKNEKKNNANKNINNNKNQEFNYSSSRFPIYGKRNGNYPINSSMPKSGNKKMNDFELNSLKYRLAINLDKRNFFQYYFSLLKIKHLILFAFIPNDDYNIRANKICFFIISFSLYFIINGFFFNDNTMHDIYSYNGDYNSLNQISIILYSSIISFVVQIILKLLCLSEKYLINLKKEKKLDIALKKSISVKKCLMIKFLIFYVLGILLMIFFWYFITCFCAVYHNTQIILIKDTLISFAFSFLYPLIIYLLPGALRFISLRNKNRECLYKLSIIISKV